MIVEYLAIIAVVLAAIPLTLGIVNCWLYRAPRSLDPTRLPPVSVLIPARNEEARIAPVLERLLKSEGVAFEVIVADDGSTDSTAEIVGRFAARDNRVELVSTPPLPSGWAGKTHACHFLSGRARYPVAVFMDADVELAPDGLARIASFIASGSAGLVSGFPHQIACSFWEKLVIPMIHVLFLGYLPMIAMRRSVKPEFGTACGQLLAVRMDDYRKVGGHGAIAGLIHDGVQLPRVFRRHGVMTDLFDADRIAATRMYDNLGDLWRGFSKNAHEGMATPVALPVWTVLLGGAGILPFVLVALGLAGGSGSGVLGPALLAVAMVYLFRLMLAIRFRQSLWSALLHPLGVAFMLTLQWVALIRWSKGGVVKWRGRAYSADR